VCVAESALASRCAGQKIGKLFAGKISSVKTRRKDLGDFQVRLQVCSAE